MSTTLIEIRRAKTADAEEVASTRSITALPTPAVCKACRAHAALRASLSRPRTSYTASWNQSAISTSAACSASAR